MLLLDTQGFTSKYVPQFLINDTSHAEGKFDVTEQLIGFLHYSPNILTGTQVPRDVITCRTVNRCRHF
jgi:hypothetical protein